MVVKISKTGNRIHEPPYTKAEQEEFYRRVGGGPVTVVRSADARKGQKSQEPQQPPAKPRTPRNQRTAKTQNGQGPQIYIEAHSTDRKSLL